MKTIVADMLTIPHLFITCTKTTEAYDHKLIFEGADELTIALCKRLPKNYYDIIKAVNHSLDPCCKANLHWNCGIVDIKKASNLYVQQSMPSRRRRK